MVAQSEVSFGMNEKENKNEQKNSVVEAMLRAREKEMQQPPAEEELPGLTSEEYDDMYLKIIGRLKAEGLMQEEHPADSETEAAEKERSKESKIVAFQEVSEKKKGGISEKISAEAESAIEEKMGQEPEEMTEEKSLEKATEEMTAESIEKISADENEFSSKKANRKTAGHRPAKIRWFQRKATKVACVCLVGAVAVFGLSMTSEANRLRLLQTANEVLGTGDLLQADNGEERLMSAGSEDEAKQEIAEILNVKVPEFLYLPEGMTYQTHLILDDVGYAKIQYSYKEGFLYLEISNSLSDMSQGNMRQNQENSGTVEEIETLSGKILFDIKAMEEKGQYTASWEYKNSSYLLWGQISQEEMKKIIENLSYDM